MFSLSRVGALRNRRVDGLLFGSIPGGWSRELVSKYMEIRLAVGELQRRDVWGRCVLCTDTVADTFERLAVVEASAERECWALRFLEAISESVAFLGSERAETLSYFESSAQLAFGEPR